MVGEEVEGENVVIKNVNESKLPFAFLLNAVKFRWFPLAAVLQQGL